MYLVQVLIEQMDLFSGHIKGEDCYLESEQKSDNP